MHRNLLHVLIVSVLSAVLLMGCTTAARQFASAEHNPLLLWYPQPADDWNQALPLGNGRLGAMVYGSLAREELQLNEDAVWAGGPNNNVNPAAADHIAEITRLIFAGRHFEAQALADQHLVSATNHGMPYQTLGSLLLDFPDRATDINHSHYKRDLDIGRAIASVSYRIGEVTFRREVFASLTDDVIVVQLTADKPGQIHTLLGFSSPMEHELLVQNDHLQVKGRGSDHEGQAGEVRFVTLVKPLLQGGQLSREEKGLRITGADSVVIHIAAATNFVNFRDLSADPFAKARTHLTQAQRYSYAQLRERHQAAYQAQFNRVSLDLGTSPAALLPTDQRVRDYAQHHDPQMAALYFQFGRYLLISSSQPGTQPANLQGIWNRHTHPAWDSKYTVNINTEMNYWPAELTNLSELHEPLFAMLRDLSISGRDSASKIYGAGGWMMHHNTDIWRITGQVDPAFWGQWQGGGAWLAQHIGYRYAFTGDREFLREHYPILREASQFFVDTLKRHPAHGWLVVVPSNSPENDYRREEGKLASIAAGTTMDNQLVWDLFSLTIDAAQLLNKDAEFTETLKTMRAQLPPMQIGQHGQLQEWLDDWDDPEDNHRHVSHLYGLHPSNQISPFRTPELFSAVRTSMEHRGDESTGWSMGWKINLWARLLDGNRAYKLLQDQISLVTEESVTEAGGTYANLFDAHPPFQIDGNFGVTAGIAEMLVQSHDGAIHLLPALPDAWPKGQVKGLVTRGGFVVDMQWDDGQINKLIIHSRLGGICRLRLHSPLELAGETVLRPVDAATENPNPFFRTPQTAAPLIHAKVKIPAPELRDSHLVEFTTSTGGTYEWVRSFR